MFDTFAEHADHAGIRFEIDCGPGDPFSGQTWRPMASATSSAMSLS
jgi:hypothetical protein